MMSRCIVAATAALASAHQSIQSSDASLIWQQHVDVATYTHAAIARHQGAPPTFATSTWLNQPIYIEVYNISDNGNNVWSFGATNNQAQFSVDMSRHADSLSTTNVVDTFAAELDGNGNCVVRGFVSYGPKSTGKPVWSYVVPMCQADLTNGAAYVSLQASDNGATVAFLGYVTTAENVTARVFVLDGQAGTLIKEYAAPNKALQGDVSVSDDGSKVVFVNEPTAFILDLTKNTVSQVPVAYFIGAAISDSGNYFITADNQQVWLYTAQADGSFSLSKKVPFPAGNWLPWDVKSTTTAAGDEVAVIGFISGDVLTIQVIAVDCNTGKTLMTWTSPTNAKLQNNPTVRTDGDYIALASWGDSDDIPTAILLTTGSNTTLVSYTTPGSMFATDVVIDSTSASQDVVYFSVAGKAVPANAFGNGGDAYTWKVTVNKA